MQATLESLGAIQDPHLRVLTGAVPVDSLSIEELVGLPIELADRGMQSVLVQSVVDSELAPFETAQILLRFCARQHTSEHQIDHAHEAATNYVRHVLGNCTRSELMELVLWVENESQRGQILTLLYLRKNGNVDESAEFLVRMPWCSDHRGGARFFVQDMLATGFTADGFIQLFERLERSTNKDAAAIAQIAIVGALPKAIGYEMRRLNRLFGKTSHPRVQRKIVSAFEE